MSRIHIGFVLKDTLHFTLVKSNMFTLKLLWEMQCGEYTQEEGATQEENTSLKITTTVVFNVSQ